MKTDFPTEEVHFKLSLYQEDTIKLKVSSDRIVCERIN